MLIDSLHDQNESDDIIVLWGYNNVSLLCFAHRSSNISYNSKSSNNSTRCWKSSRHLFFHTACSFIHRNWNFNLFPYHCSEILQRALIGCNCRTEGRNSITALFVSTNATKHRSSYCLRSSWKPSLSTATCL